MFLLDDNGAHLVVASIYIDVEWDIKVGVCHQDISSQNSFHDFESLIHIRSPTKGFLPDSSRRGLSIWALLGHISWCVVTGPRKLYISLRLHGGSRLRMAEIHFFQDLRPIGINQ